ncbi:hypothetical protein NUW58_g410 [Xylaria curta]|uniref:Uncharacterized protein n=1 Tax=Xylaria curta TaxID=42375 RepID=A0ACC1PRV3_9PEZI|nr:hypothetical protein NUW58_g410 [Xylaria curta]
MREQWDLDSLKAEEEEIYKKEKDEARLKRKRFNWLSHDNRGASYISYNQFSNLPATSFEFGADGFAGACNGGGELLHLSAPSKDHGLIFARGAFSSSLYSCISRAQTEHGGSATFGLRLARDQTPYVHPTSRSNRLQKTSQSKQEQGIHSVEEKYDYASEGSSFRLGEMIERGCFNYRWPLNEHSLLLNSPLEGKDNPDIDAGYCTRLSYFKHGVCYQVIRLEPRSWRDIDQGDIYPLSCWDGQVILEIGGSIYFQLLKNITATGGEDNGSSASIKDQSSTKCLRIIDERLHIGLEAQVYQLSADGSRAISLDLTPYLNQDACDLRQPSQPPCLNFNSSESTFGVGQNIDDEASVNLVYRATAKLHTPSKESGGYGNRSETFIAAIRLIHSADTIAASKDLEIPSSEIMHEDVWVEPVPAGSVFESDSQATGVMWETILQWRDLHTDSMSEFTEISLIARCLEKILQVDLVPSFYGTENPALAVISNPFMRPIVSLRSLFWKVRFLAKVHHFLAGLRKNHTDRGSPKLPNNKDKKGEKSQQNEKEDSNALAFFAEFDELDRSQMISIAASQCNRIRNAIEHIISFLVELLSPSESTPLLPQFPTDQSELYYITMTIWYVVKSFRKTKWKSPSRLRNFKQEDLTVSRIPPDNHNFGAVDKRKIILLKWYHYGSLLSLADRGILPSYWRSGPMKKRVYSLSNAATTACTGSTELKSHYSVDDEIVDRLSFLAHELGMEEFDATAETVTSASIQRVREREFTKYLNPGVSLLKARGYGFQETSGPWEIHALCHNSRVNVLTLESESEYRKATKDYRGNETREKEVAVYKNKVYRFLNSEATLIPCWERSPMKMRSGWLQSEAAAVHGSTLLDIHNRIPVIPKLSPKISPQIRPVVRTEAERYRNQADGFITDTTDDFDKDVLSARFREMIRELKGEIVRPINWESFRPPLQYYPDSFINSLEDTPHLFRPPVTDNVFIPTTLTRLAERPGSGGLGRHDLENLLNEAQDSFTILDILVSQQILSLRKYQISRPYSTMLPDMRYYRLRARPARGQRAIIKTYNGELEIVKALFDSLVDQSVQHRILYIHKLTKKFVQVLAFVVHPEAVTCLSNHVLHTLRFSFHKGPIWMTSITVGSWILANTEQMTLKHESAMTNESVKLPDELRGAAQDAERLRGRNSALTSSQSRVSFFVSSAVLTTNAFGDFSRCTIISEVKDENKKMKRDEPVIAEISNEIWQVFVHQPQTARCLVFLHVLGMLCAKLCKQYRHTITEFEFIVPSTEAFLLKERDWTQDSLSLSRFQLILWGLDCLYKFRNSLKTSIANILDAKKELLDQIHEQAANRSLSLQAMCQEYIANFESGVVELTQVNEYLESNIALAVRFKDALSETLALRDSRVGLTQNEISLDQNNAIQALTYLTIGYLPLGLITAIFAIPQEQNVLFQGMGPWWFVGAIFILSAATYIVVAWLSLIVDFFKFPSTREARHRENRPNLWKGLRNIRQQLHSPDKSLC